MKRRTFVKWGSALSVGGLAGCSAPTGDGGGEATAGGTTTEGGAATEGETTTEGGAGGGTQEIAMITEGSEYYFDPIGLFVEPGTTVEWVIESGSHSSTAYAESLDSANVTRIPEQAEPWDSGILTEQGASFSYTFEVTGTYDYFCLPHKSLGMIARIVCGEPGDVEGDPPDGAVPSEQAIVNQGTISYEEFSGGGSG
ncbi:plastocyanin/azurin family copper-binding protein [Halorussus gelatinilyticus]|uniref:Plastocyanin/azurin family copper-binding protein n=1 Tax=Halorussus gelatinilyticus TaxID=2937524 RepID=A0A8U0IFN4_9EURY|nr:plastocyanin/azurin family copper-binding protein [Halorussus gelatinilyticus]UPV99697.1 plastocyanin/azurin family copper-binding protein [Halorussus gelatinilyticus]